MDDEWQPIPCKIGAIWPAGPEVVVALRERHYDRSPQYSSHASGRPSMQATSGSRTLMAVAPQRSCQFHGFPRELMATSAAHPILHAM